MERSSAINPAGSSSNRRLEQASSSQTSDVQQAPPSDRLDNPSTSSSEPASASALMAQRTLRHPHPSSPISTEKPEELFTTPVATASKLITLKSSVNRFIEDDIKQWAEDSCTNTENLLDINGQVTRYGLVEIGGRQFIIGPRPDDKDNRHGHIFQRLIDHYPQIGRIFGVDPDIDTRDQIPNASARPPGYVVANSYVSQRNVRENVRGRAAHPVPKMKENIEYHEFQGIKRNNASKEAYWQAGHSIAQFIKNNPQKVVIICSENGLSRPCAVATSAIMLLREDNFAKITSKDFKQAFMTLGTSVAQQRSAFSASDLLQNQLIFRENFNALRLINSVRNHGVWNNEAMDVVPSMIPQTHLLGNHALVIQDMQGNIMHRYGANYEEHGEQASSHATPDDIYLFQLNIRNPDTGSSFLHYEVGNRNRQPWNQVVTIDPDGDCFFRALHRALPENLRPNNLTERSAIAQYRNQTANYLMENMDRIAAFIVPESLSDAAWESENLKSATIKDVHIPPLNIAYTRGMRHTDMITQEEIDDPKSPSVVRVVYRGEKQLATDNKFFNKESIENSYTHLYKSSPISDPLGLLNPDNLEAFGNLTLEELARQPALFDQLHATKLLGRVELTHPTTNIPILGFIDNENKLHDIEMLLGTSNYIINPAPRQIRSDRPHSYVNDPNNVYRLPKLPAENRMISFITDANGKVIGGPAHGQVVWVDDKNIATHAVFFQPILDKGLVCYTDPITHEHIVTNVPVTDLHKQYAKRGFKYTTASIEDMPTSVPSTSPLQQTDAQRLQLRDQRISLIRSQFTEVLADSSDNQGPSLPQPVRLAKRRNPLLQRLSTQSIEEISTHRTDMGATPAIGYTSDVLQSEESHAQESTGSGISFMRRLRNAMTRRQPRVTQPPTCAIEANTRQIARRRDDDPDQGGTGNQRRQAIANTMQAQSSQSIAADSNQNDSQTYPDHYIEHFTLPIESSVEIAAVANMTDEKTTASKTEEVPPDQKALSRQMRLLNARLSNAQHKPSAPLYVVRPSHQPTEIGVLSPTAISQSTLASRPEIQKAIQAAIPRDKNSANTWLTENHAASYSLRRTNSYQANMPSSSKRAGVEQTRREHFNMIPHQQRIALTSATPYTQTAIDRGGARGALPTNQHLAIDWKK